MFPNVQLVVHSHSMATSCSYVDVKSQLSNKRWVPRAIVPMSASVVNPSTVHDTSMLINPVLMRNPPSDQFRYPLHDTAARRHCILSS